MRIPPRRQAAGAPWSGPLTSFSLCLLGSERLLFLDELENGLHYGAVRPFLETLLVLSRAQDMQVFATTHSMAVLQSLLDVLGDDAFSTHRSTTNCYTLQRDREGHVRPYATSTRSSSTACDTV